MFDGVGASSMPVARKSFMRLAAAVIAATLAWPGCGSAGADGLATITPGQDFTLRPGQVAQTADQALRVGFTGVAADSRCPKGEQCVVAGHATVRVWMQQGTGAQQAGELRTAPARAQTLRLFNHALRLVALEPYPVTGQAMAPGSYLARFSLVHSGSTDPDR